jgi:dynein heavy chain
VSSLFNRDEQSEIIVELIPIMKRELPRMPPTPENILEFFEARVRQNLHVVLCFSPVSLSLSI